VNILAIDIGGTKFTVTLFEDGRITRRESRATDRDGGRDWMLDQIETLWQAWQPQAAVHRCGIGFGGPVDFERQQVALSTHAGGWRNFDLPRFAQSLLRVPVVMDNDANAGALGEAVHGAGKDGARPLFYLTLSTGVGGGIVFDGSRVYRGADSWAGEIGHVTVQPDGPECLCGARGCLERLCGGLWLERDFGRPVHQLMRDAEFVHRYAVNLAAGLKTVVMLLNPARIVIGGGIANAGEALFAPLRDELRRQVTPWSGARLDLVPAALGDDSVLWGAFALASSIR